MVHLWYIWCDFGIEVRYKEEFDLTPRDISNVEIEPDFCKEVVGDEVFFSIDPVLFATGYKWNVPSFVSILRGGGLKDTFLMVKYTTSAVGVIEVKGVNSCLRGKLGVFFI